MGDSEYFADKRIKNNTLIKEKNSECEHNKHLWSNWFCVPGGLARECKNCHKIKLLDSKDMKEIFA